MPKTKQGEIREWAKKFLQGTAHNGFYDGLELTMLEELSQKGVVLKVEGAGTPTLMPLVVVEPLVVK